MIYMYMEPMASICPHCGASILREDQASEGEESKLSSPSGRRSKKEVNAFYFCPQCGKKLRDRPPSTSFWRQVAVYAIAVFLPPFGLWPGVQYLKQNDEKSRRIGIAAIILTVLSFAITVWLTIDAVNSISQTANSLTNLGY